MIDISALAPSLRYVEPAIWCAPQDVPISYPQGGNAECLQVEDGSFWFRHRNRCISALAQRFSAGQSFLDVGGGNGYVARGLTDSGLDCVVLEPGWSGALAAHARGIESVICARLDNAGLPPMSFGAAGMFDVLEHIEDESAALRQVHALLEPGGHFYVTVPAYAWLFSSEDRAAGHFRRYTVQNLARAVSRVGFQVAHATYLFSPLPPLIFALRTLPSRLGVAQPANTAAEHAPDGLSAKAMNWVLDQEYRRIVAGGTLPFGSSCLLVAVKA